MRAVSGLAQKNSLVTKQGTPRIETVKVESGGAVQIGMRYGTYPRLPVGRNFLGPP